MQFMFRALATLSIIFLIGCKDAPSVKPKNMHEEYPGNWVDNFNLPITKVLSKNSIRGCGEFYYRPYYRGSEEYLVACTRDGINWTNYVVWLATEKASRISLDGTIEQPR